jgi:hypothetical protein
MRSEAIVDNSRVIPGVLTDCGIRGAIIAGYLLPLLISFRCTIGVSIDSELQNRLNISKVPFNSRMVALCSGSTCSSCGPISTGLSCGPASEAQPVSSEALASEAARGPFIKIKTTKSDI